MNGNGGNNRKDITVGATVDIVLKQDQRTGKLTRGRVQRILTKSPTHPHGIKVMLEDGQVGRVKAVWNEEQSDEARSIWDAKMNVDDFIRDYFDDVLDENELHETLLQWLIDEDIHHGPINSFEDAEVLCVELLDSDIKTEGNTLIVKAKYITDIRYEYADDKGQGHVLTAKFELAGVFTFAGDEMSESDPAVRVDNLKEAQPAKEIRLLSSSDVEQ